MGKGTKKLKKTTPIPLKFVSLQREKMSYKQNRKALKNR